MGNRKFLALCTALAVAGALAVPALAHAPEGDRGRGHQDDLEERGRGREGSRPAQTKMRFKLDDHQWASGATVTGTVALRTGRGRGEPLIDAMVRVLVDGTEVGIAVTDSEGKAAVSWGPATDGGHVMRVVFDGDDIHKRARKAQGFYVGESDDDDDEDEGEEDDVEPSPTPVPETTPTP